MADGFRPFRVARKHRESGVITSFYLAPADGGPLWSARPGQYLTLRVPSREESVLKTYSLSCAVDALDHHRITVKREGAPATVPDAPEGQGSCWLHDRVAEGDVIEVAAPRGGFVLDEESEGPVLLLAGGVGLTPLLSMLHRLAGTRRRAWFVQACENGEVHAMRDEVAALVAGAGGRISARAVYRAPTEADRAAGRFDAEGLVDRAFLQALLPLDHYQVYLCGPTPFMVAMYRFLTSLGIAPDDIRYEFFGKAASLPHLAAEAARVSTQAASKAPKALAGLDFLTNPEARAIPDRLAATAAKRPSETSDQDGAEIVFARSGVTARWDASARSLLELAENAGLEPTFSCREGICGSCRCGLREGSVEYFQEPLDLPRQGEVLICSTRPQGRVVLDL